MMDAVLPLLGKDLPRARLLAASLARFVDAIETLWLVAPENALEEAARVFEGIARCEAIPETELVPELGEPRIKWRPRWRGAARPGYRAQQLIKLGISHHVGTDFYLTLDADVMAVAPIDAGWLLPGGKARTVRFDGGGHRNWYAVASEILSLPASRWEHGVTPCVLSRNCARSLVAHLDPPGGPATESPLVTRSPPATGAWRSRLLARNDWTEYTLYHTFVEAAGAFDAYHLAVPPEEWYGANVWGDADWAAWTPASAFQGERAFRFCVLQSTAKRSAALIEAAVMPYLEAAPGS